MKRKIGLFFVLIMLVSALAVMFTVTASAEEAITVTYNWYSGGVWETAAPNEDGSYTLRQNKKSGNGTVTLTDGTVVDKEFYGWFDEEGNQYEPGATVTFTKSTRLYEAYGVTVYNADDLYKVLNVWKDSTYVKLGADITIDKRIGSEWDTTVVNLNGFTLTNTSKDGAFYVKRGAIILHGKGKIVHAPASVHTSADVGMIWFDSHGYGDDGNPQLCWIGKDLEVETPYNLLYVNGVGCDRIPNMVIAGAVNARTLARINPAIVEARCYIASSAVVNVTTNLLEFKNTTGSTLYMTITLDGVINVAKGTTNIFTDLTLEKANFVVNGGKFCISKSDSLNISYYLSDEYMLKETVENELTWYEIVLSDCAHEWVKDDEASVVPTIAGFGKDVYDCGLCGREKTVVTVYNPANTEITITVRDEAGETKEVIVKAGDVLELAITGVGENTNYTLIGVKGSEEYPATSIVAVEVPLGVSVISATVSNETLETLNIVDGAEINVAKLDGLKALKTINIGAATVKFNSIGTNTSLEAIHSEVAGATVTFSNNCFDGKSNLKYLTMANGSSYSFGKNSFKKTSVETVIFPDEATIAFAGEAAFYNASTKYVYIGASITTINNKPFDCANNLELVVIKAATYIDQYCFCVAAANNSTAVLKVYCHSENISINGNAFINRQNNGVEFYTIDPDITSLSGCTYKVFNGIPHAYTEGIIKEPTCIETGLAGSTTDCVCGVNEVVTYTVYTSSGSEEFTTAQRELPLSKIHVLGTVLANINYKNGYLAVGTKEYYCALCNEATVEEAEASANAIFESLGYSVATYNGTHSITQGYKVDAVAYEAYVKFNESFTYGIVAAGNASGEALSPLSYENGQLTTANDKVLVGKFAITANNYLDIKVTGITEEASGKSIILCVYVADGERVQYLENGKTVDTLTGVSYSSFAN